MASKLLCRWFGHRPVPPGWWGDVPYQKPKCVGVDNIGRSHFLIEQDCDRCGERWIVARFHDGKVVFAALQGADNDR